MQQKPIKIKFVDFWDGFLPEKSLFYQLLSNNYEIELSDEPDYLFFSVFGNLHLQYNCIKIFYTGENQCPDFNLCDYAIGFEHLSLRDRYFRLPNYYLYPNDFLLMENKSEIANDEKAKKKQFCSFVYSNNHASPEREIFFQQLSSYKKISSGGRYKNNVGGPVADKLAFQRQHKFSIAFENTSHDGYTTEKLVQSFAARTIPIYWGNPAVSEDFNEKAFINCHQYASWDEVVEAIKKVDTDNTLYEAMLRTPALRKEEDSYQSKIEQLTHFLRHIIDQPLGEAPRYSRFYWGNRYVQRMLLKEKAFKYSPRGIVESIYQGYFMKHRRDNAFFWKIDRLIKKIALH